LEIIPVLNKVDLQVPILKSKWWYCRFTGCKLDDIIHASGKTGFGVENIHCIMKNSAWKEILMNLTSFDFDSHYNPFRGIEVIFELKTDR
jgi:GTP-binding protein LepA